MFNQVYKADFIIRNFPLKAARTWRGLCLMLALLTFGLTGEVIADDAAHHQRAKDLREASKARAQQNLGYETLYDQDQGYNRQMDYQSLGLMMQRLGAALQAMEKDGLNSSGQGAGPGTGVNGHFVPDYGPDGPTVKSVRLILDYRLMLNGNNRLQAGEVTDEGAVIMARVVTRDGALVDLYKIDKKTGVWSRDQAK